MKKQGAQECFEREENIYAWKDSARAVQPYTRGNCLMELLNRKNLMKRTNLRMPSAFGSCLCIYIYICLCVFFIHSPPVWVCARSACVPSQSRSYIANGTPPPSAGISTAPAVSRDDDDEEKKGQMTDSLMLACMEQCGRAHWMDGHSRSPFVLPSRILNLIESTSRTVSGKPQTQTEQSKAEQNRNAWALRCYCLVLFPIHFIGRWATLPQARRYISRYNAYLRADKAKIK